MIHRLECEEPWFSLLRSGKKRVEGRKASARYLAVKVGDMIEFYWGKESFRVRVRAVERYESVEAYLRAVGVEQALPGIKSFETGVEIYHQWTPPEAIAKIGFLAIFVGDL